MFNKLQQLVEDARSAYAAGEADDDGCLNCMVKIDGREVLVLVRRDEESMMHFEFSAPRYRHEESE